MAALGTGLLGLVIRTVLSGNGFGLYKMLYLSEDITKACTAAGPRGSAKLADCIARNCTAALDREGYGAAAYGNLFVGRCIDKISAGKFYQLTVPLFSNVVWIREHPNHVLRFLRLVVSLWAERMKYYFIWKTAEGSCLLAGFGFQGYDAEGKALGWRGVENVDILGIETAWSVQVITRAWNKKTQKWLEMYTYHRTGRSLLATYFVSAFWHGLYPGFYTFFLSVPAITELERLSREKLNPILIPSYNSRDPKSYPYDFKGVFYIIFGYLSFYPAMNFITQAFSQGTLVNCHRALGAFNYINYAQIALAYVVLMLLPKKRSAAAAADGQKVKKG